MILGGVKNTKIIYQPKKIINTNHYLNLYLKFSCVIDDCIELELICEIFSFLKYSTETYTETIYYFLTCVQFSNVQIIT